MNYRREIDGLRAISVVSVVLYHAQFQVLGAHLARGGYIGVDIFFVISGYLITRLIAFEIEAGNFSISKFYERRIRRIMPALLVVLFVTGVVGWLVLSPQALQELSGSVVSTLFFYSNIFFWLQDSYIAEPSQLKPLLHTWSLSVEEQFYLVFPLLMIFLSKFRTAFRIVTLCLIAGASLSLSHYLSTRFTDANFFLTPSRMWELLFGSLLALVPARLLFRVPVVTKYLPSLGLAAILGSVLLFSEDTHHPSLLTLFPVVGCCLVIAFANLEDPATKLLSAPPFVRLGLISYSLYLWHFPVFAFLRVVQEGEVSQSMMVFGVFGSLVLAGLSWRWVEQPFRSNDLVSLRQLLFWTGVPALLLVVAGALGSNRDTDAVYHYIPDEILPSFQVFKPTEKTGDRCIDQDEFLSPKKWCSIGPSQHPPSFLLVGDSHAEAIAGAFDFAAQKLGRHGLLVARSGCPQLLKLEPRRGDPLSRQCLEMGQAALEYAQQNSIKTVIFASRWNYYTCGEPKPDCGYTQGTRFDDKAWASDAAERLSYLAAGLNLTLTTYSQAGVDVFLVAQVPHQKYDPKLVYNQIFKNGNWELLRQMAQTTSEHESFTHDVLNLLEKSVEGHPSAFLADPATILCGANEHCKIGSLEESYYSDDDHVSVGSVQVMSEWAKRILEK